MANYTITAAGVLASAQGAKRDGTAGATIVQGNALYLDAATGKLKLCDANSGTAAIRAFVGIALNAASDGQPIKYVISDPDLKLPVTAGGLAEDGTLNPSETICVSATPGALCEESTLVAGDYKTVVGVAKDSDQIKLAPVTTDVAIPEPPGP